MEQGKNKSIKYTAFYSMCSIENLNIHIGQPIHAGYIIRYFQQTFDSVSAVITVKVEKSRQNINRPIHTYLSGRDA